MNKQAHTPGPWQQDGQYIAAQGVDEYIVTCHGADGSANARLIAAAPELLAALRKIVAACEAVTIGTDAVADPLAIALSAIAKAEGSQ